MKIAILGFGREGQATLRYLQRHDFKGLTVCDQERKKLPARMRGIFGKNYLKKLSRFDLVFRSPGISIKNPTIQQAKKSGTIITSATQYFFERCPAKIIGVTGTKGKGTVATLIVSILKKAGKKAVLCGNIGVPALDLLDRLTEKNIVVMELSSFQLQDLAKSPHIAVVLGITSEHLDYHATTQEYQAAKKSIIRGQTKRDHIVYDADNAVSAKFAKSTKAQKHPVSLQKKIYPPQKIPLPGLHNRKNVYTAIAASRILGVQNSAIDKALRAWKPRPHRLEPVGAHRGIHFINDSAATMPEATIAALRAFRSPLILIAGGSDKGANYKELGMVIAETSHIREVILNGPTAPAIARAIPKGRTKTIRVKTFQEAMRTACKDAQRGDTILLSPASASFDQFKNYEERGEKFRIAAQSLTKRKFSSKIHSPWINLHNQVQQKQRNPRARYSRKQK